MKTQLGFSRICVLSLQISCQSARQVGVRMRWPVLCGHPRVCAQEMPLLENPQADRRGDSCIKRKAWDGEGGGVTRLGSSMPDSGLKLMPVHMSTAAPKSISLTLPAEVISTFSCRVSISGFGVLEKGLSGRISGSHSHVPD